jgi:hypothetical protein
MKTVILPVFILFFVASYSSAQPEISFTQITYDFATIGQQDQVEHVFEFANTGDQELVIDELLAS